jgi:hypothetical protein
MLVRDFELGTIGIVHGGGQNFYGMIVEGRRPNSKGVFILGPEYRIAGDQLPFVPIADARIVLDVTAETLKFNDYGFQNGDVRLRGGRWVICVDTTAELLEVDILTGAVQQYASSSAPKVHGFTVAIPHSERLKEIVSVQ